MKLTDNQPERDLAPAQKPGAWNSIAGSWHEWIPHMREWYLPATDLMLDLAQIEPGDKVLDIAAGDCDQSIAAAERVGPEGHILAFDAAPDMVQIGARVAREAGFHNIETRVMDAGNLELAEDSFDAAICRFALMLLPEPTTSLREASRVIKQGARASVVVYAEDGAPEFMTAVSVIRKILGMTEETRSAENLGNLEVLQQTFEKGGFRDIDSHVLQLPVRLSSARECVRYLKATSPTLDDLVSKMPEDDQRRAWEEVEAELAPYEFGDRFEVEHQVIVAAGSAT
jgi:ubiquinone/menaquinone biosynthesis C-methylase UbiE